MPEWTPEARKHLSDYLDSVAELARRNGDDADEIVEELHLHIATEVEKAAGTVVTVDHLRKVLATLGTPEEVAGVEPGSAAPTASPDGGRSREEAASPPASRPSSAIRALIYLFAVALPLFSLLFELATGTMGNLYFSPIDTPVHFVALLLILVSIVWTDFSLASPSRSAGRHWSGIGFGLNGFAFGLSTLYFLIYLPILPVAAICVMGMGLGLMGFSPMFCMLATGYQLRRLHRQRETYGLGKRGARGRTAAGIVVAIGMMLALHGLSIVRYQAMNMAVAEDETTRERGMRLLRTFGGEEMVLEACYGRRPMRGLRFSPVAQREWAERGEYRKLYFRLTGKPFNSVAPPRDGHPFSVGLVDDGRGVDEDWRDVRTADSEIGGTAVAGRVKGLSLNASTIDAKIVGGPTGDPGPAVAYLEWILEFKNQSAFQREARAQILLPHGAVASRLSLWINGEERDAAFGQRSQAREAYQEVAVVRRRDPALLTTAGADRILLQCFPVQPDSTLKAKIGMTAPLLIRQGRGYLRLPSIDERNFTVPPEFRHDVWAESATEIAAASPSLQAGLHENGVFIVRGKLREEDLQSPSAGTLSIPSSILDGRTYTASLGESTATMTIRPAPPGANGSPRVLLVVDGSARMKEAGIAWRELADSFPGSAELNALFAGQEVRRWREKFSAPAPGLADWIESQEFAGGCDPVPALEQAWDLCVDHTDSIILWLHAPVPVELSSTEGLAQRFRRRPTAANGDGVRILSVCVFPGPNRIAEGLGDVAGFEEVPLVGTLAETLTFVVENLRNQDVVREYGLITEEGRDNLPEAVLPAEAVLRAEAVATSRHLVRLAVYERVRSLARSVNKEDVRRAAELAVRTRLVTPVSGAVVLESRDQYARHGLDPGANEEAIPAIPEPEEWVLIIIAAVAMLLLLYKRYRPLRAWQNVG